MGLFLLSLDILGPAGEEMRLVSTESLGRVEHGDAVLESIMLNPGWGRLLPYIDLGEQSLRYSR